MRDAGKISLVRFYISSLALNAVFFSEPYPKGGLV